PKLQRADRISAGIIPRQIGPIRLFVEAGRPGTFDNIADPEHQVIIGRDFGVARSCDRPAPVRPIMVRLLANALTGVTCPEKRSPQGIAIHFAAGVAGNLIDDEPAVRYGFSAQTLPAPCPQAANVEVRAAREADCCADALAADRVWNCED